MAERTCLAIVLAAGEGTRMRSARPKVLHQVAGQSLLAHALEAVRRAGGTRTAVVIAPGADRGRRRSPAVMPSAEIFVQSQPLGTAHAVLAAAAAIEQGADDVLVIFADTPLIRPQTLVRMRAALADGAAIAVLGFRPKDPTGYGRLLLDGDDACRHPRGARRDTCRARHRSVQWRADGVCRQDRVTDPQADRATPTARMNSISPTRLRLRAA